VAGARMAATALAGQSAEQAAELDRVLVSFDRTVPHLGPVPRTRPAEEPAGGHRPAAFGHGGQDRLLRKQWRRRSLLRAG
jgi:hypothetical protein